MVAVKPHASPAFHAIQYLIGELDRAVPDDGFASSDGLQAYPSRTKDPDPVDFSTGLGRPGRRRAPVRRSRATATCAPTSARPDGPSAASSAMVGDAELDEGNVWEAIAEDPLQGLGNVTWIVDLNRQSLDRVIPGIKARAAQAALRGSRLAGGRGQVRPPAAGALRRGPAARCCAGASTTCPTRSTRPHSPSRAPSCAPAVPRPCRSPRVKACSTTWPTTSWRLLVPTSAATTSASSLDCYRQCDADTDRPSIVFAYTIKGWGLPIAGDPLNHSALLLAEPDRRRCAPGSA